MEYVIISDDSGTLAVFRQRKGEQLTPARAFMFVTKLFPTEAPNFNEIYPYGSRAPRGGRRIVVYLSNSPDGIGRIGRNWVDFVVMSCDAIYEAIK